MKKCLLLAIVLFGFAAAIFAQTVVYNEDFNGVAPPDLPDGWSANSPQIFTNSSSASSGYSGASGGNNLLARNCNPNGEERSFQVDGISSVNYENLNVSFGHRRTNSFTPPVTLEWSSDGSSWTSIAYNSGSAGTAWALFTSAALPPEADNQANLSFRWTYTTAVGNTPCDNFAGNYRIDDFKVTAQTVLPIELFEFLCFEEKNSIHLTWRTAAEISNHFFAIERSADGRDFAEIGRVTGAGTSQELREYAFTDEQPLPGTNYYRLRQVDFDGQFSYSKVVSATVGQSGDIRVFPSPATDFLKIQLEKSLEENAVFEIFDPAGRLALSGEFSAENSDFELNVTEFPEGIYFLRLVAGRETFVKQFLKK